MTHSRIQRNTEAHVQLDMWHGQTRIQSQMPCMPSYARGMLQVANVLHMTDTLLLLSSLFVMLILTQ